MILDESSSFFPNVLLVDDEEINLIMMAEALKEIAHVHTAVSGEEALVIAKNTQLDLVVLDIEMPNMNGFELCEKLNTLANTEHSAIIFVTSHSDPEVEYRCLQLGAMDFLSKPVDMKLCQLRVRNHLNLKYQEAKLNDAKRDIQELVRQVPIHISYWSSDFVCQFSNDFHGHWPRSNDHDWLGKTLKEVFPENLCTEILRRQALSHQQDLVFDTSFQQPIDGIEDVQVSLSCRRKQDNRVGYLITVSNITAIKRTERALATEKERLNIMLNSIGDAVIATDENQAVMFMNPIAENMTGWLMKEAKGVPIARIMQLNDVETGSTLPNPISVALEQEKVVAMALNCQLTGKNGKTFRVEDSAAPIRDDGNNIIGGIIVFHDVSESIAMAVKMSHLANHDQLTDLPNRILLHDRIIQACKVSASHNQKVAVLLIDIDHFKYLNDTLGHTKGDEIIVQIAKRLRQLVGPEATLSRTGGDEFAIAVANISSDSLIDNLAKDIVNELNQPFILHGEELTLSVSVGISFNPDDADGADVLMTHADAAMYRAKQQGRNQYCYFSKELETHLLQRHSLEKLVRKAIETETLEVFYQPKFALSSNKLIGAEALVRIRDEEGVLVSPDRFIPIAEETGLIVALGTQVLQKSCEDAKSWAAAGHPLKVAVNIAAKQFSEPDFCEVVERILRQTGLDGKFLELEVTESALMHNHARIQQTLKRLSSLGLTIAIDDFGTGYSSLSYLKLFSVDVLKIDQSFVKDMFDDEQSLNIVKAVIHIASSLGLSIIGEGIEQQNQQNMLSELGCQDGQGYLYSKPLSKGGFDQFCLNQANYLH
jgi:diguanylate cyclase (GGDEF)-like protein/PAS domain S-box-containing protein